MDILDPGQGVELDVVVHAGYRDVDGSGEFAQGERLFLWPQRLTTPGTHQCESSCFYLLNYICNTRLLFLWGFSCWQGKR